MDNSEKKEVCNVKDILTRLKAGEPIRRSWHLNILHLNLLRIDGSLALVGAPEHPLPVAAFSLIPYRRSFAGSMIGGIAETHEMLNFCGKHNIVSDIEMINVRQINEAYDRLLKGDVKYRFVIDMASLKI
jgi:alcohol dehydrogenase (NADP+)